MNNTKIPGEHLRKELITNHYGNDFLNDFANTIIQNIPDQGEVRRIDYAAKIIELKINTKSTHAIDFYGYTYQNISFQYYPNLALVLVYVIQSLQEIYQ